MARFAGKNKKRGWGKALAWTGGIAAVLLVASLVAWNMAMDKLLGSLGGVDAAHPPATSETRHDSDSEVIPVTGGSGEDRNENSDEDSYEDSSEDSHIEKIPSTHLAEETEQPMPNKTEEATGGAGEFPEDRAQDRSGTRDQAAPDEKADGTAYTPNVSEEKAEAIKENISLKEKAAISGILLKKLSASDISTMVELASGGMTVEEKRAARAVLLEKLTEEEYNTLIAIAAKYGVSQGKTYREVKRETDD